MIATLGTVAIRPPNLTHLRLRIWVLAALIAGAAIGFVAWGVTTDLRTLLVVCLLPVAWRVMPSRWAASALMMGYFAAGARGLPRGAVVFFGDTAPVWWGGAMWLGVCVCLSAPFALCWTRGRWRGLGFVAGLSACAVPPLGIVGWLSPMTAAGVLFPGRGWLGLALTVTAFGLIAGHLALRGIVTLIVAAAFANAAAPTPARAPERWLGFDTSFARLSSAGSAYASQLLASMDRIQWLNQVADQMPANAVLVLPETLLGRFDGVAEGLLSQTQAALAAKHSRVLAGAELPGLGESYGNALVVLGAQPNEDRAAIQGIPVPISMWRPWATDGASADLLGRGGVITVMGKRVAVSVCYEQLLTFSLLQSMSARPDVLVTVSNVWWANSTNIPTIQAQSVRAYARLFNVPVVSAKNT
jgi:hypothetical protein